MTATALTRYKETALPANWQELREQVQIFVASGLLPKDMTPEKAITIAQKGKEIGVPALAALDGIYVIQGKATIGANLLRSVILRDQGDNALRFVETEDTHCTIEYKRRGWAAPLRYTYTIEQAHKAQLTSKDNWKRMPREMLRARATSAVAQMAFTDSTYGMYTPEELGAEVELDRETGELVPVITEIAPEPAATPEVQYEESAFYDLRRAEPEEVTDYDTTEPAMGQAPSEEPEPTDPRFRAASANQLTTIRKLARLLGQEDPGHDSMTSAEAADAIAELSRAYNEARNNGGQRR